MHKKAFILTVLFLSSFFLAACAAQVTATLTPRPEFTPTPTTVPQNLIDLVEQGQITVSISGGSINTLALHVRSDSGDALQMDIPAGTYFVNKNPASQNMVVIHSSTSLVQPYEQLDINLAVACANLVLTEPNQADTFSIQRSPDKPELAKIITELNSVTVDYEIEQAAIWIVTDDATFDALGVLVEGSRFGNPIINENNAVRAMMLVEESGIDVHKYAIWGELGQLRPKVTETDLLAWMANQAASEQASITPTAVAGEIGQYATKASAGTQFSLSRWSAMQAVGAPDTSTCGEPTAWASLGSDTKDWLLLDYDQAVIPTRIVIYESNHPGAITQVEVTDEAGQTYRVYSAAAISISQCPFKLEFQVKDVNNPVRSVRVTVDQSSHDGRDEIDAVQLFGTPK